MQEKTEGRQLLFLEPNPDHAINNTAAHTLRTDPPLFESQVHIRLRGVAQTRLHS